jgi:YidC/Oxa1 family membrane protein insertase
MTRRATPTGNDFMSSTRSFLFAALAFVAFLLWQAWQQDYGPKPAPSAATTATTPVATPGASSSAEVPRASASTPAAPSVATAPVAAPVAAPAQYINVHTDLLHLTIDTRGGAIVRADLLSYPIDPAAKDQPVRLLDDAPATFFVAQSGLVSADAAAPDHQAPFAAEKTEYTLSDDTLEVPLTWSDASGLKVRKVYKFTRGSYLIESRVEIDNGSAASWSGNEYRQLQRVPLVIPGSSFNNPEKYAFTGAAWYSPQDKFKKLDFTKFTESPLKAEFSGGWAALLQHYFFAAWIPAADEADAYSTTVVSNGATPRYLIRALSPAITVAPGASRTLTSHLYIGPTLETQLGAIEQAGIAKGLSLTADYGMLTPIAEPMHWILVKLQALVGNWGVAIILLVLLIKLAMFKLSEAQFRSMAKMKKLQPRMEALKERYGDDRQKLSAATMELYQKEKINPLGGCLPTLIQIPVFFALYWVLLESVELRQAPFFGWIQNLSAPDPFYVLPGINFLVMIGTMWLQPASPGMDPMQQRMMKAMPLIFAFLFAFFPAGLVLYYAVNGGLGLLQQWIITKRLEAADAKARAG